MSAMSRPLVVAAAGGVGLIAWAVWYDSYRRGKPGYRTKLVEKRRQQLKEKRMKDDPHYYLSTISLCDDPLNPNVQQMYMMQELQKGEGMLEAGDAKKGCAHIAMGLGYLSAPQVQMTLANLRNALPPQILSAIVNQLTPARQRCQRHIMEETQNAKKRSGPAQPTLESARQPALELPIEEEDEELPVDCDSIDGDTESIERPVDTIPMTAAPLPAREALKKPNSQVRLQELAPASDDELDEAAAALCGDSSSASSDSEDQIQQIVEILEEDDRVEAPVEAVTGNEVEFNEDTQIYESELTAVPESHGSETDHVERCQVLEQHTKETSASINAEEAAAGDIQAVAPLKRPTGGEGLPNGHSVESGENELHEDLELD